jgi:hypothetical protein
MFNSSHPSLQGFSLSEFVLGGFKFCALLLQPFTMQGPGHRMGLTAEKD